MTAARSTIVTVVVRALSATAAVGAALLVGASGGVQSEYTASALLLVLAAGLATGSLSGGAAGLLVSAVAIPSARAIGWQVIPAASWLLLFPAVGAGGGLAARIARRRTQDRAIHDERMRIARDLHDGVAQALAHLRFELDLLSHEASPSDPHWGDIGRLGQVADRALNDLRAAVKGLRTAGPEGLVTTVRSFLDELDGPGMPEILFTARGAVHVSDEVAGELFRVVQEAVSNAVRHARAGVISVALDADDETLELIVEDDGVGIAPRVVRDTTSGVGLIAMRERAERIGAQLDIGARASGGTRVRLATGRKVRRLA